MSARLPVPIEFQLPEGWSAADPEQADASGVAFAALHPELDDGFAANITIDGEYRPDEAPLAEIADGSVQRMREIADSVAVANRKEIGSADAPGLTQTMTFAAEAGGVRRALVQIQVYLAMLDVHDPAKRAVIRLALTATPAQLDNVLGDFRQFVETVRPDTGRTS
ncbi:hypothetical protein J7E87_23985 [Streptomyces sp. ISL-1]|uniref:hypothetical protein n=1 Tax=Streptomyces sp. ISL-1 TaxID=2817657 RepID=UPI001BEC9A67|nr:hypothetical protein [Streptomyces sp. ISL-1]MBT2392400.1 hypothetical protein [Streptomyces sp. ISL-1]